MGVIKGDTRSLDSGLMSPIVVPYIIPCIPPAKEFRLWLIWVLLPADCPAKACSWREFNSSDGQCGLCTPDIWYSEAQLKFSFIKL